MLTKAKSKGTTSGHEKTKVSESQSKPIVTVSDPMDIDRTEPQTESQTGVHSEDKMDIYISPMGILTHLQVLLGVRGAIGLNERELEAIRNGYIFVIRNIQNPRKMVGGT